MRTTNPLNDPAVVAYARKCAAEAPPLTGAQKDALSAIAQSVPELPGPCVFARDDEERDDDREIGS